MTPLRHLAIRNIPTNPAPSLRPCQRRWARVQDVRFVATQQAKERITDRYRDRLQEKARSEGYEDVSQLKEAYKDRIKDLRKSASVPGATAPLNQPQGTASESAFPSPPPPPPEARSQSKLEQQSSKAAPGTPTLSSFLDVPKTLTLPPKEIEAIWRLRHASNPSSLCASIPTSTFSRIAANARRHPQFVLPGLPRTVPVQDPNTGVTTEAEEPAVIHFLQWTFPSPDTASVMFTHLAEYKLRGEYASPHTTLTAHLEMAGPKGLVLCQGSVVEGRGVSVEEGKWLVMCLQKFYTVGEEESSNQSAVGKELHTRRKTLMEQFSQGDENFKLETLVEEAERIG